VAGYWTNPSKSVVIDIVHCGHTLCGSVTWASEKAKRDAQKGAPHLVGTRLLTDLKEKSHHHWQGKLFVPDQNMRVTAKITLVSRSELRVAGCAMMGTICKSQLWTRSHRHSHA